jgi:hypothetical protein
MATILPMIGTTIVQGVVLGTLFAGTAELIHDVANYVRGEVSGGDERKQQVAQPIDDIDNKVNFEELKSEIDNKFPDLKNKIRDFMNKGSLSQDNR